MLDVNRLRVIDAVARHRIGHRGGEGAALLPAVGHATTSPGSRPRPARSCCSGSAAAIRLTPAGQLLADRAAEIIGRIDAAGAELSAHVGLTAGRVRLASFASVNGSLVPAAVATLATKHPGSADQPDRHASARRARAAAHRQDRRRDHLPLRRDRARARRASACTTCSTIRSTCCRRVASTGSPRCATRPGSPAATAAAATCCPCAPTPGSIPGSATAPTTWS